MSSSKIDYFDHQEIVLSKKRKSEEPWTICKQPSSRKRKLDNSPNNGIILNSSPNQTLDMSEKCCTISTPEMVASLQTKDDKELAFSEEMWPTNYNHQRKSNSVASSNSMPELCEYPNSVSYEGATSCEDCRFNSIGYESSNTTTEKGIKQSAESWHQQRKCHSAPTCTPFPSTSRNLCRKNLFKHHSLNDDSPAFEFDTSFLSKRPSICNFPSYDISIFDNLCTGFVDTHCHLDFLFQRESFKGTYEEYRIKHSYNFPRCYEGCVAIFCDPLTFEKKWLWEDLLKEDGVWAAFGCHPHNAGDFDSITEKVLRETLKHPRVVALGEIGLDYSSRNSCSIETQHNVFRKQLKLAVEADMPIVIHCRNAHDDCIRILKEEVPLDYHIHRHCFTGEWREAEIWLNTFPNLYLGITGLVTFPSAKEVHEVVKKIPLNRLLLETDAPYFVPRHETLKDEKWSRPGMALHVAAQIAALRPEVTLEKILHEVRGNTYRLYGC